MTISKKIILTGSFGVGKTSLFNQFIYSTFSERYLTTIGVKVNKKTVEIDGHELTMLIWDIAGEVTQDKVPNSYFLGAEGIVYVFDLTRPTTLQNLKTDLAYLKTMLPDSTIKVVGNKLDLVQPHDIERLAADYQMQADCLTSAKTGENVEKMFTDLGAALLANAMP
jgi:small GTP-binding protein